MCCGSSQPAVGTGAPVCVHVCDHMQATGASSGTLTHHLDVRSSVRFFGPHRFMVVVVLGLPSSKESVPSEYHCIQLLPCLRHMILVLVPSWHHRHSGKLHATGWLAVGLPLVAGGRSEWSRTVR